MYIVRPHQTSITLFQCDGEVVVFYSAKQALKKLGYSWIVANVGPHFRTFDGAVYTDYQYIMRNDVGEIVSAELFASLRVKSTSRYRARQFLYWNGEGAVPGTGKPGGTHYFRNIRYVNAKRAAQYFSEEGEIAPRVARSVNVLPDA